MQPRFSQHEIDHHTLKLIVGIIALTLANLTALFSVLPIASISASYHEGGWARDIFVGFLFAISAFLLAYNGSSVLEMVLSKAAAIAAMGVAMFPCACGGHDEVLPYVHSISAAILFVILSIFCGIFYRRASAKHRREADWRARIYAFCGVVIIAAVFILALDGLTHGGISDHVARLTFYGERAALVAFGISWLVASRVLPVLTGADERVRVLPVAPGTPRRP